MKQREKGITLIALIITIIILLILAGISISALTNTGLFARAQEAKEKTEEKTAEENATLNEYEQWLANYTGGSSTSGGQTPVNPADPTKAATSITEAQSNDMLTKTVNSPIEDANGNKITIPAGFKIKVDDTTNNATTVDKGIVIVDSNENEFVWIPVGKIYTDTSKTEANAKTIELGRYSFASDGTPSTYSGSFIEEDSTDTANLKNYGNTIAKDINAFKTKASASGGFYIGRYEARTGTARSSKEDPLTTITEKGTDSVYNYVTQIQAAERCQTMYGSDKPFTSDLMNSYAWDTATLFLQTCGTNSEYSSQASINSSLATTGTNDTTKYTGTQDVQCNVYDMASNTSEWTTETCSDSDRRCVIRGGRCNYSYLYTCSRDYGTTSTNNGSNGFRPLLYV